MLPPATTPTAEASMPGRAAFTHQQAKPQLALTCPTLGASPHRPAMKQRSGLGRQGTPRLTVASPPQPAPPHRAQGIYYYR